MWSLDEGRVYESCQPQETGNCDPQATRAVKPEDQEFCGCPTQKMPYPRAGFFVFSNSPPVTGRKWQAPC